MPRLSLQQRLRRFSETVLRVHQAREETALPGLLADAANAVVPSANASFNRLRRDQLAIAVTRSRGVAVPAIEEQPLIHNLREHLPIQRLLRDPAAGMVALDDCYTRRAFHRTTLYNEYYRRSDTQHQLVLALGNDEEHCYILAINRQSGPNFSRDDRELARLLQPHLQTSVQQVRRLSRWREVATSASAVLDDQAFAAVLLDGRLQPVHCSEAAHRLLRRYFPHEERTVLPTSVHAWLQHLSRSGAYANGAPPPGPFTRSGDRGQLVLTFRPGGEQVCPLLLLHEDVAGHRQSDWQARWGLTPREAEILHWITEGKNNPEIAGITGISVRTVHKHVERVLAKLGAEHRHAAARTALGGH